MSDFKVYLVGGAVRDKLLGCPVSEHDYVVVGASPEHLLAAGFSQVGADFPVFLHPHTHEEYALARTERKSGKGYLGFDVYASCDVSLEQDLLRRDLTINAMAIEVCGLFDNRVVTGEIIDPYGGQTDLKNRTLRHVSDAFVEDPVRVLRLARFASRYAPFGFGIANQTCQLVADMKTSGELNHLVAERVWAETKKALNQSHSAIYFDSLDLLGVLDVILPEFAASYHKAKHTNQWQIISTALHNNLDELLIKFGILSVVFANFDDKTADMDAFLRFCQHQKIPKEYQKIGLFVLDNYSILMDFQHSSPKQIFHILKTSGALKNHQLLMCAFAVCADLIGAQNQVNSLHLIHKLQTISADDVDKQLQGKAIGAAIDTLRLDKLSELSAQMFKSVTPKID